MVLSARHLKLSQRHTGLGRNERRFRMHRRRRRGTEQRMSRHGPRGDFHVRSSGPQEHVTDPFVHAQEGPGGYRDGLRADLQGSRCGATAHPHGFRGGRRGRAGVLRKVRVFQHGSATGLRAVQRCLQVLGSPRDLALHLLVHPHNPAGTCAGADRPV